MVVVQVSPRYSSKFLSDASGENVVVDLTTSGELVVILGGPIVVVSGLVVVNKGLDVELQSFGSFPGTTQKNNEYRVYDYHACLDLLNMVSTDMSDVNIGTVRRK